MQQYLGETGSRERVRLVLNRFRKVPGFSEADAEAAVGAKLLWRIPNQYFAISARHRSRHAGDGTESHRDCPLLFRTGAGIDRNDVDVKRAAWSLFKIGLGI